MEAILVMWPKSFEQSFISSAQGGCTRNLVTIGSVAFGEMFENVILRES